MGYLNYTYTYIHKCKHKYTYMYTYKYTYAIIELKRKGYIMKLITFSAIKGGVGKTTLAYNYGEWLANKGYNILFIDLDHQCNLTQIYDIYDVKDTIANAFTNTGDVKIQSVGSNIDIIAGNLQLDKIESQLENKSNKDMLLYMWLDDNYEDKKLDHYDYIIFDCHPDFSVATRNAIAVSHTIISPITPSEHGYRAKFNLEERLDEFKKETIDYKTRESYVTGKLYFVGNMIKHNTKSSRDFLETVAEDESVITYFPSKELMNKSTLEHISLPKMEKNMNSSDKIFFENINKSFNIMTDVTKD